MFDLHNNFIFICLQFLLYIVQWCNIFYCTIMWCTQTMNSHTKLLYFGMVPGWPGTPLSFLTLTCHPRYRCLQTISTSSCFVSHVWDVASSSLFYRSTGTEYACLSPLCSESAGPETYVKHFVSTLGTQCTQIYRLLEV